MRRGTEKNRGAAQQTKVKNDDFGRKHKQFLTQYNRRILEIGSISTNLQYNISTFGGTVELDFIVWENLAAVLNETQ